MSVEKKVIVVKADDYQKETLNSAFKILWKKLDADLGIQAFINKGEKVLIKPNLVEGLPPKYAVTTHPEVLRQVIQAVLACGAIPLVGDSPGLENPRKAAQKAGFLDVCLEEGAEWLNFKEEKEFMFMRQDGSFAKVKILAEITEVNKVISLAKMKTHSFMMTTGTVKNLFGLVVGLNKAKYHLKRQNQADFAQLLLDILQITKPVLGIVDGIIGMEGQGPRNGKPKFAGLLFAGTDCLAIDLVMSELMGFQYKEVPLLALAEKKYGKCLAQTVFCFDKGIKVSFEKPHNIYSSMNDLFPKWLLKLLKKYFTAQPSILKEKCVQCGKCIKICQIGALFLVNKKIQFDSKKCISCFCCQEFCPCDAIKIKKSFLFKIQEYFHKK